MMEAPEAPDPSGPAPTDSSQVQPEPTEAEPDARAFTESSVEASGTAEEESAAPSTESVQQDEASALATEPTGEGGEAGAEDESAAGAEPGRRKRRRRKKGKGKSEAGEQDAPALAGEYEGRARRRESPAPFLRFFSGPHSGRKHGFAVEEAVAGRVKEIAHGVVAIDLFGKAVAYADEHEPREVPPMPEPVREPLVARTADATAPVEAAANPAPEAGGAVAEIAADTVATAVEASAADAAEAVAAAFSETPVLEQEGALAEDAGPEAAEESVAGADAGEASSAGDAESAHAADVSEPADADAAVHAEDADDADGETTLSGDAAPSGHGPLPPAPVVPDEYPRLEPPRLGQVFRGRVGAVAESGHIAIVNRVLERKAVLANLERYRTERRRLQGIVFGFNRGGFDVLVEGVRAFCPASAMALEEIDEPLQYLGQKLEFLLPASQVVTRDIVVSRRSILERLLRKKAKELVRSLEPGQRLKGKVTQVREFGLFVDIGGIEGLVHQSELSFAHGTKPHEVAQVGDEVEVQVLRVGADPRKDGGKRDRVARVSLSIKALLPDPWDAFADSLKEGSAQKGKVTRTTDFGAFIELAPQIEGLLHISELGRDLKHANQAVKEGDELAVVVERVDRRARRISLSKLSQHELEEVEAGAQGEGAPRNVKPGSRISVKVSRVEARGLAVRVSGVLGKRARGFVPSSEMVRGGDLRKLYPPGTELEVKVIGIERDGGLRCSPKALQIDDERRAVKDYRREAAKQGFGTFGDLLRAKLGQADSK